MKPEGKSSRTKKYAPILPGPNDWPVVWLAKNRKDFVEEVTARSFDRLKKLRGNRNALIEELELTLFKEKSRVKFDPWPVDPEDEKEFWGNTQKRLAELPKGDATGVAENTEADTILRDIVGRYSEEIAGNFKESHYKLTRALVTFGLTRFLNGARLKGIDRFFRNELSLMDKIHIVGETDRLRSLAKKGTVVMVPTHFSNLDSVVIGWVINTLGLPPLIYGAGLNLFNLKLFAYFMNSLGAYKVDRRKKNLVYVETLKTYSSLALQKGIHSLFFPGGTRSRSGKLEKRLKLGLLSTAIEAQRTNYQNAEKNGEKPGKIFVVPVCLNYNFVFEAEQLIKDYLKRQGQERYYIDSEHFSSSFGILKFIFKFMMKGADVSVSIGKPMDLFGNFVDDEGDAFDQYGRKISMADYFKSGEGVDENLQRETVYTRMLGDRIIEEFHRINRVSSAHLAAFVTFHMLRKRHRKLDLYSLLRLSGEELVVNYDELRETFIRLRDVIFRYKKEGRIGVADHMSSKDIDKLIREGVDNCGMYHPKRPLRFDKKGNVTTQDINTLYYYSNRLVGYGLEKYI
ncbi:hypothetical protein FUAX_16530 [Fulvitalea axinellae]|uniref:Glycerol-3-phosphate acyltransferase n=1 Tax=Fulvitalea axinellae TaxID=1182444 RepID=A0AAU9D8K4_9BACT|nr:hypothetical protein FUAX_16530 [Fulvitalea axinellae]